MDAPPRGDSRRLLYGGPARSRAEAQKNYGDDSLIPPLLRGGAISADASRTSRILILRGPAAGALGDQIEEVPDGAEIVARREAGVGHPEHPAAAPAEHRHPGMVAVLAAIAHVGRER